MIVFQDQVLEVAMALAGFSAGEAEGLRRAMSRKRSDAAMAVYQERFVEGAVERGVERDVAERVFEQVRGFSGFGFPKAHAAAFGLLAYQSTWLRVHYAPEFLCALLNEQPMGFYPPDSLVHEAQRRGDRRCCRPHVNLSAVECRVERARLAVRIGLGYISGSRRREIGRWSPNASAAAHYADAGDLAARSGAGRDTLERLAWAGACDGMAATLCLGGRRDRRGAVADGRRERRAGRSPGGVQLALPLEAPAAPGAARADAPGSGWSPTTARSRIRSRRAPARAAAAGPAGEAVSSRALERLPTAPR